jgi:hypothetical protein
VQAKTTSAGENNKCRQKQQVRAKTTSAGNNNKYGRKQQVRAKITSAGKNNKFHKCCEIPDRGRQKQQSTVKENVPLCEFNSKCNVLLYLFAKTNSCITRNSPFLP